MRRLAGAVLGIALLFPGGGALPAQAALPCDRIETQAQWTETGWALPNAVGHHVHLATCWPKRGTVLPTKFDQEVTVILHDLPAGATSPYLRVGWGLSGTIFYKRTTDIAIPVDSSGNGSRTFVIPMDLSGIPNGVTEFRFTYDVRYTLNNLAREQFNTTGWLGCVGTCTDSSPDRALPWIEMRGWYSKDAQGKTHNYQNVRLRSDVSCLRAGGVCKVEMKPGSSGLATVKAWALIDADLHAGRLGTVLLEKSAAYSGNIFIPADLAPGTHKLLLVASDGKNAGAGSFTFDVP